MLVLSSIILALIFPNKVAPDQIVTFQKHAEILHVSTDLPKIGNWWRVPKGVDEMTIFVKANNTETVLFWLIPTGTQTWGQRELIGYDKDGSDGWTLTWKFGNRVLHDHIHVQALGDQTLSNSSINITTSFL
ncbi:hypothetical protein EDM54_25320 [Brevibacillus borstelensis]|uniref:hypothetical protein n=1 Tax=Brevibacillus borstelensis TaxID=45462 RepID=UPI000F07EE8A|nr:hypothetical protein [Brevibacillus borstelensis]MED1884928.1 hypothetical protein [Brevibacillus borstelensis]RNB55237.1 hypothetical protein EDM54_25320 [Brevibacillus borstelensis]GED55620.1 hypothetical protein BBO01nite_48610 [Brevibacillus borstelensis]